MADDKEKTQRRVYVLPSELVDRITAYQNEMGLTSEVEAARRLLDNALQARDTVTTLLDKVISRYTSEKDLRLIASDILMPHSLVKAVSFDEDGDLQFVMKNGHAGSFTTSGKARVCYHDFDDSWSEYPHRPAAAPAGGRFNDMDDDIPF